MSENDPNPTETDEGPDKAPSEVLISPSNSGPDAIEAWKNSRSGAWAGRGFHYQHLVSTLILIRQWAGLAPSGSLVPEGFEDCV